MTMITRDLIVPVTKHTLAGIGFGTVTRQPKQDKARVAGQPAADVSGRVNAVVVGHHVHAPEVRPGIDAIQGPQQIQKQEAVLLRPGAVNQFVEKDVHLDALDLLRRHYERQDMSDLLNRLLKEWVKRH